MKKIFLGFMISLLLAAGKDAYGQLSLESLKFSQFVHYLDKYYVDSIDTEKVVEEAIKNHLKQLDPHSTYITADEVKKMNEPLQGNFEGIGISFNILDDTLFVISPIPGGPSEKVGILAGDRILLVEEESIAGIGLTNDRVFKLLRGEKGTVVKLSIKRRNVDELLDFKITRDKIPINSLDASYKVNSTTGYIKLNRFSRTTMKEFLEAAIELRTGGANDLILDLTGNAGGYLDMAVDLADQFLDESKLIVYTEGLNSSRHEFLAETRGIFEDGRIVILIDEGSASASEIVSGAIQDWDRGVIIGRRSFGKGLVQRQLELPDGSMIRLTTARYYTPSGRLIQKPYTNGLEDYHHEIANRYTNGEFLNSDSIDFPDSLQYETLVNKRKVFGGGGIMPDIFIPLDTTAYSDYYRDLIRKGILNQFVLQYVDKNRSNLKNEYEDISFFKNEFQVDEKLLNKLISFATKQELKENREEINLSNQKIRLLVKAYIARDIWGTSEFYQVINTDDANFNKAIEVLENWQGSAEKIVQ